MTDVQTERERERQRQKDRERLKITLRKEQAEEINKSDNAWQATPIRK